MKIWACLICGLPQAVTKTSRCYDEPQAKEHLVKGKNFEEQEHVWVEGEFTVSAEGVGK